MKVILVFLAALCFSFLSPVAARAALYDQYEEKAAAVYDGLRIISFSDQYDEARIRTVYDELLLNFHADELRYLSAIYLYPDSPEGMAGHYYEDIRVGADGRYTLGNESYIELFHMDQKTPEEIAPVLAHEYGHHYTLCNITLYEDRYYSGWAQSEYARLRSLAGYPIVYSFLDKNYSRRWDIAEIAACDYVQLLGSPNAKKSWLYKDAQQRIAEDAAPFVPVCFNMRPQENVEMPVASSVEGLFQYLLEIGGYTGAMPKLTHKPKITGIAAEAAFIDEKYTLYWEAAAGEPGRRFEYTVVSYPADSPEMVTGIKTVTGDTGLSAVFGTVSKQNGDGSLSVLPEAYTGLYVFYVYAKDDKGYLYASDPFLYHFGGGMAQTGGRHMVVGVGTDVIEIDRIGQAAANARFVQRCFTDNEAAKTAQTSPKRAAEHMAGLFAAKEAVAKAIGTGFSAFSPADIEILPDALGKPRVFLHGAAKKAARARGIDTILVSVSHCETVATACAVAEQAIKKRAGHKKSRHKKSGC